MDEARDLALAGAGFAGEEHADVEGRHERHLPQEIAERLAPSDDAFELEGLAKRRRRVGLGARAHEQAAGERREMPREELRQRAILVREHRAARRILQV